MDERENIEKREFARARVSLPVQYNIFDLEGYNKLREKRKAETRVCRHNLLAITFPLTPISRREETDYDIRERLEIINNKLDYLIGLIIGGVPKKEYKYRDAVVELSGAGLRIMTCRPIPTAMYLELCLIVPFFPYFIDDIYGQVKRVISVQEGDSPEEACEVAVEFIEIEDGVREKLIQLTFEKQRELLRSRREEKI
ncbi:MAG: hypothetical protein RDU59_05275 [Thermodesulfobacteriota bacterium]|nr:hypothetical protein [Thermodesulfobacteriota bacterium]